MNASELKEVWKQLNMIPAYQHVLFLMNERHVIDLVEQDWNQLTEWDTEQIKAISNIEKEWKADADNLKREIRKWRDEESELYVECRTRFLKQKIQNAEHYLDRFYKQYELNRRRGIPFAVCEILAEMWDKDSVEVMMKRLQKELYRLEHRQEIKEGEINEEMISVAKEYPFTKLLEFNYAGFARCPYHKEHTPSFSLNRRQNYAHCFGCGRSVDTIQYVIDNMDKSFVEAVKYLNQ